MLVGEAMTTMPVTVRPSATIAQAAAAMSEHGIGDVIVTNAKDEPVGILTDRDIVTRVLATGRTPKTATVKASCTKDLVTIGAVEGLEAASALMREHNVRRLPVVSDDNKLVGIVSLGDLAHQMEHDSCLAAISKAPPNN